MRVGLPRVRFATLGCVVGPLQGPRQGCRSQKRHLVMDDGAIEGGLSVIILCIRFNTGPNQHLSTWTAPTLPFPT